MPKTIRAAGDSLGRRSQPCRKLDDESCSPARPGVRRKRPSPVSLHHRCDYGQAQPAAPRHPAPSEVGPVEPLEEALAVLRVDPGPSSATSRRTVPSTDFTDTRTCVPGGAWTLAFVSKTIKLLQSTPSAKVAALVKSMA